MLDEISPHLALCGAMSVVAGLFKLKQWKGDDQKVSDEFRAFQWKYLVAILFMKTADWLQGPYVYALYRGYGYNKVEIGHLFICGFGMSGFVGVWVGNMADRYGRKKGAVLFTILYSIACICYHFQDFWILVVGRACAGVGTALLYTVFEAWYKSEHEKQKFKPEWISGTFNKQTFGDAVLAILAGLCASALAKTYSKLREYGDIAAFDASLFCLVCGGVAVFFTWGENCAEKKKAGDEVSVGEALRVMWANPEVLMCGLVQSLFGGSMYIFVFMWTPSLPADYNPGIIFSCFMVAIMIGTCVFGELEGTLKWPLSKIVLAVCIASAFLLYVPVLTTDPNARLAAFIGYEGIVGVWFPSYHTMRAQIVPDRGHATILSFYRLPLNCIVVFTILNMSALSEAQVFSVCFAMMTLGSFLMYQVHNILQSKQSKKSGAKKTK